MSTHVLTYAFLLSIPVVLPLWAVLTRPRDRRLLGAVDAALADEADTYEALRDGIAALRDQLHRPGPLARCDGAASAASHR